MDAGRRRLVALAAVGVLGTSLTTHAGAASADVARVRERLAAIERDSGGRLGVCIVDTDGGFSVGHRPDERFPMCSTFKLIACATALHRVDRGEESLDRRFVFGKRDLVAYSPVTERHLGGQGMSLAELCEATLTTSDNTAANLILASYGGPKRVTAFARHIGDPVTRLDRIEPALNEARPGDPRDTTSPWAMLQSMRRIVLGDALQPASRASMERWLLANRTGGKRLKAGLPADWQVADRTGTSGTGTTNDIGVVWPAGRAPLLVTAYLTGSSAPADVLDATLAKVGALLPTLVAARPG